MHINEIILAVVLISGIAVALYVKNKKPDSSAPTSTPTTPPPAGTSGDGGSNDPDWTI
jgi:uncharacterized membrane protein